jgi:hypothetical protein
MSTDLLNTATLGGLDAGRGMGSRILHMTGAIKLNHVTSPGIYAIDSDGTVTVVSGTDAAITDVSVGGGTSGVPHGCGIIESDVGSVTGALQRGSLTFRFPNSIGATTASTAEMQIVAATCIGGIEITGSTAILQAPVGPTGPLAVATDMPIAFSLNTMTGNSVSFWWTPIAGNEDGLDTTTAITNVINFSMIAFAIPA